MAQDQGCQPYQYGQGAQCSSNGPVKECDDVAVGLDDRTDVVFFQHAAQDDAQYGGRDRKAVFFYEVGKDAEEQQDPHIECTIVDVVRTYDTEKHNDRNKDIAWIEVYKIRTRICIV